MAEDTKQPFDAIITDQEVAFKMKYELLCPHCGQNTLVEPYGSLESGIINDTGKMIPTGGKWWVYHCRNDECQMTSAVTDDLHTKI